MFREMLPSQWELKNQAQRRQDTAYQNEVVQQIFVADPPIIRFGLIVPTV